MFGCLGRLVVLIVLAAVGAVAWFTRDRWLGPTNAPPPASAAAWHPVTDSGAAKVEAQLTALGTKGGKAYVNVRAADLLGYVLGAMRGLMPAGTKGVEARATGDMVFVRGEVNIAQVGGAKVLGPLAGMLPARDTLQVGGTLEVLKPGLAQLRVKSIRVKDLDVPAKVIPPLLGQLRGGARPEGVAEDGVAIPLPANIGDLRIKDGKITVYGTHP
jgi:hypothetical protein